jgi:aryl-alcohol dehydrogenase-like predicted oxidoreductase
MPLREGATVFKAALAAGVNFIDTAELYGTYPYIREAIKDFSDVIVSSKSYAYTYDDMRASVERACRETGRNYVDIFMLHEQVSRLTLKGHREALSFLVDAKAKGLIRAIGVSTHTVEVVKAATLIDEIDVIHPLINMRGVGILDGTAANMQAAINDAAAAGKGIYTMKALGGGHLIKEAEQAIKWVLGCQGISSVAVGMQSTAEVAVNCALFSGQAPPVECVRQVGAQSRRLFVEDWCIGCGTCQEKCPMGAITVVDGKAVADPAKCVFCGYCGAHCPEFCLKII